MKRVFHAPVDLAGQMGLLVRGLRERGWQASGYNWFHPYLNYGSPLFQTDAYEAIKGADTSFRFADLIHFHNGNTLLSGYRDLPPLKRMGKKMVMHHWGSDVRIIEEANQRLPFPLPKGYYPSDTIRRRLVQTSTWIEDAIIQDRELYPYVSPYYKRVHILPLAIDLAAYQPKFPDPVRAVPLVLHAPTNPAFKGTALIEAALSRLKHQIPLRYMRVERMSHREARRWYEEADIIIDQVLCGSYGLFSVEAMALGKPVVAYLTEEVRKGIPYPVPIVTAHPARIEEALLPLLRDGGVRRSVGEESRRFVERYHAHEKVTQRLMEIYEKL